MGRKILNRKEMRADFDAAERRKDGDEGEEAEETDEEGDEDADEEGDEEADEEGDEEEDDGDEESDEGDDEDGPPKKKKKKAKPAKPVKPVKAAAKPKSRTRTPKVVRMKVVWGVFNNSNQRVAVYEYSKRKEADDHAAKLMTDKKMTHFVQPVKEVIEEAAKKE